MINNKVKLYRIISVELTWGNATLLNYYIQAYEKYITYLNILDIGGIGGKNLARSSKDLFNLRNIRVY